MSDWRQVATENFSAALELVQHHWRSALSRTYYAAYARITAGLERIGVTFPDGQEGPSHKKLPALVENSFTRAGNPGWRLSVLISELYRLRIMADYRPSTNISAVAVRDAARMMQEVFRLMERL